MEKYILIDSLKREPLLLKDYVEYQDDEEVVNVAVKKKGLALMFASYDQYKSYEERGKEFNKIVFNYYEK